MKLESITYPQQDVCTLTISATAEEFETAIQAVYDSKKDTLKIPGMERGQASRADAERMKGEDFFWFDAANNLMDADIPAIYDAVVAEHQFIVVDECRYDIVSVSKTDGFVITTSFCLLPDLKIGDYKSITVTQNPFVVTDQEVEHFFAMKKDVKPEEADQLRAQIRERLTQNKLASAEAEAKNNVMLTLGTITEGAVPIPMIDEAYEAIVTQLNEMLQQQKATMQDFLDKTGHTKEQFRADTRKGAEARVRATLAIIRLGVDLGAVPTAEEVEAEVLYRAEVTKDKVKDFAQKASRRRVAISMIRKKAVEHILEYATIIKPDEA